MAALDSATIKAKTLEILSDLDSITSALNAFGAQSGAQEAKAATLREQVQIARNQAQLVLDAISRNSYS
jgi:hypothetical protein